MNVLLHVCCANCAIYPIKVLRAQGYRVSGFFFNPNIHPYLEYRRRLETVREYAGQVDLEMFYRDEYLLEQFLAEVSTAPESRCGHCYRWRIEETARFAAAEGFDAFTSSLLYSRYQQHEAICDHGRQMAQRYDIAFLDEDFRIGWREGIDASRAMGLYRQQYCGCIYSEKDRYHPRSGT